MYLSLALCNNQGVTGCELDTSLVSPSLPFHFQLSVNKEGKGCQFLFGAVSVESSLSPS